MFTFQNVLGNKNLVKSLRETFISKRVFHSYIFSGESGMGKKFLAFSFAKLLLCENPQNAYSCNKCSSCLTFESKNNPDFIFISSDKKSIGIEVVRENILKNLYIKPFKYKYKIFVVENADDMSVQAQNTLLKVIEEPPKYVKFLLLSKNYNQFLPTILSRCITFTLNPLDYKEIYNVLIQKHNVETENAKVYSIYSQGSVGRALKILSQDDFINMRKDIIFGLEDLFNKDLINMYNFIAELEKYKSSINDILEMLFLTYRDFLIFKNTKNLQFIIQKDIQEFVVNFSKNLSNKRIIKALDYILHTQNSLEQNANFTMAMEYLFIKLKEK